MSKPNSSSMPQTSPIVGEFAPVPDKAVCQCGEWPEMEQEFPEFADDVVLPPIVSLVDRNSRLALEQANWDGDKIGTLPKSDLFYNGLNPVDFIRAFHDTEDSVEKIDELIYLDGESDTAKMFYTKMNLSPQHINNQFTDTELEGLCYERPGTRRWYSKNLATRLSADESAIPSVVLDAIQECNIQQSLGRNSFRNYMRRINKNINKQKQSISEAPVKGYVKKAKRKQTFLSVKRENTILNFK
jgi:hypothetical protein